PTARGTDHPILSSRVSSAASLPPIRRPNHASRFEGIAKTKLQVSRAADPETLQSQLAKTARKRLSLSGLELLHGRLMRAYYAAGRSLQASIAFPSLSALDWGRPCSMRDSAILVRDRRLGVRRVGRVLQDVANEIERGVKRLVVVRIRRNIGLRA